MNVLGSIEEQTRESTQRKRALYLERIEQDTPFCLLCIVYLQ